MTYREAFTDLIQTLGQLYSDQASIRRIIIQVNLPIEQILFSGRADNTWADVLYKARRHNQVEDIFAVVLGEYPTVPELHTAVAGYRETMARGDVPSLPLRRCDFYAHVSLPPNLVARPALLNDVREMLLATPTTALTSAIPMDALHGMGGIGKSVVARALCDDAEVQDAFFNGILWATIGQTSDLIPRLREWVEELGGIISQTAPTINQLKQNLAELLTDRACLLILDDVWHRADAEPFLVGGPRCRMLLTTRDSEVARGLGAGVHAVPAMDPNEAVDLLELWAGGALGQTEEALKRQIVRRLGYLPLAIKLAGSQLQRKLPERWLAGFDATQLQERRVEKVHDSLARTFALSLDELTPEVRRLYVALAIFREDEATPMPGIGKLWAGLAGYGEDQTVDLVQDLAIRALLQIADGTTGSPAGVTIHDLLRDFMAAELGEAGRLAAHLAIVEAYRQTQVGAGWATALDDGYLYDHLVYHLDKLADHEASAVTELQSLFANDAWLQVRVSGAGYQYDGYLADLEVVWWRAHQETLHQIEAGEAPAAFAECMRYALIRTSVNSLSSNYEPALVARAVETGLWTAQRAFSVALKIPDPQARAEMLTAILAVGSLSPAVRTLVAQAGLAAAQAIQFEEDLAPALAALVPHLSGSEKARVLRQGLEAAQAIPDYKKNRITVLVALASHMSEEDKAQALVQELAIAQAYQFERDQAELLAALAPQLSGKLLVQALAAVQAIQDGWYRVKALAALAPQLSGKLLVQGLAAAQSIWDEWARAEALAALAPQLSDKLLVQALTAALAIKYERDRALALAALAPYLTGEILPQGLTAALAIQDEKDRAEVLIALAPHLSGEDKAQALAQGLAAAQVIRDEQDRALAFISLAPHLSGENKAQALAQGVTAIQAIKFEWTSTEILADLAPYLSDELLAQRLADVQVTEYEKTRAQVLAALAPHLSGSLLAQALAAAQAIEDERYRTQALVALAPYLSGELLAKEVAAAHAIRDGEDRRQVFAALAPHLSEELLTQGLAAALAIKDELGRARALAVLVQHLSGEDKAQALAQGLAAALSIQDELGRTKALTALAPHLSGELLVQGLTATLAIRDEQDRADALAALAPYLSGELLSQGLTATQAIKYEDGRVQALIAMAPHLSGELLSQGLATAQAIRDEGGRVRALIALAPYLSGELLSEGLAAAQAIRDKQDRADALAALAPYLSGELLSQGLAATQAIEDKKERAKALPGFLPAIQIDQSRVREMRSVMVHHLWNNKRYEKRDVLLSFCTVERFRPVILESAILSRIATDIIDICQYWIWL